MDNQIHHYTLNTGHGRLTDRCEVSQEVIDYLRPIVAAGGGKVAGGFRLELAAGKTGGVLFTIFRRDRPLVACGLAVDEAQSQELWPALLDLAAKAQAPRPPRPPLTPWLSVLLLPALALETPDDCQAVADLERCVAWTIIAGRP